jgi:hypothetical protein
VSVCLLGDWSSRVLLLDISRGGVHPGSSSTYLHPSFGWEGRKSRAAKLDFDEGHNRKNRQRKNTTKQKTVTKLTDPELSIDVCWGRTFVLC